MRITNRMITTSYTRNLNNLNSDLNTLTNQVTSGRKFSKSSEDTAAAVSAYKIRRNLAKTADYQENILHASDFLRASESTLTMVHNSILDAKDKIVTALNGSNSDIERGIIAEELRTIRDQVLQSLNINSTGNYAFGGSNTTSTPFTVDADGDLNYNGFKLRTLTDPDDIAALQSDGLTIDLGLGLTVDSGGVIDPYTTFVYSIPGIDIMEAGVDADGNPNNLYDQLTDIIAELEAPDYDNAEAEALYARLEDSSGIVLHNITKIGAKTSYLDFMSDRYELQELDLKERQVNVETIDTAEAIISYETQRVAYEAAMQMGSNIIQLSIFDFMN